MRPSRVEIRLVLFASSVLVVASGAGAVHADIPLTSDEVATRTRSTSVALAARRADVRAAEAAVDQARIALWPRVAAYGFYARYSPVTAPTLGNVVVAANAGPVNADNLPAAVPLRFAVLLNSFGVQVGLTVPASDYLFRFPHTVAAAKRGLAAAEARAAADETKAWHDGRSLYYAWARAVLHKQVADVAVDQARAHLESARSRQGAGTGLSTEAIRYESQLANAELLQRRLANLIDLLADELRTSMHDPRTERYSLGETFDPANDVALPIDFETCYRRALEHRAELVSLSASMQSETEQGKAARASMYPRLELYGVGLGANPNPRYLPVEDRFHVTWEVGARLSYSPNELALSRAESRQHKARAQSLDAQRQQLVESIREEVLAAIHARQESALALVSARKGLGLAEDSLRVRRSLMTEGRVTNADFTDAEAELVRARFAEVDARIDDRLSSLRLWRAMGIVK